MNIRNFFKNLLRSSPARSAFTPIAASWMIPNSNQYRDVIVMTLYRGVTQQDSYIIPNLNDREGIISRSRL